MAGNVGETKDAGWAGGGDARLGTKSVYGTYGFKLGEKGPLEQTVGFGAYGLTGQYGWGSVETGKLEYKLDPGIAAAYGFWGLGAIAHF